MGAGMLLLGDGSRAGCMHAVAAGCGAIVGENEGSTATDRLIIRTPPSRNTAAPTGCRRRGDIGWFSRGEFIKFHR